MFDPLESYTQLKDAILRLHVIMGPYGEIMRARGLPDERAASAASAMSRRPNEPPPLHFWSAWNAIMERVEPERRLGEIERDQKIQALANEIDALRITLAPLVSKAVNELDLIAKELRRAAQ